MACKNTPSLHVPAHVLHTVTDGCSHVCVLFPSSETLDLDDVMDIELDFPTITDSQNAQASLPTHSLSVEVSQNVRRRLFPAMDDC